MQYDVIVSFGTSSSKMAYATDCPLADARALKATAISKGFADALIVPHNPRPRKEKPDETLPIPS